MHRTSLLCAIGVSLWSAVAAGQATGAGALSSELRTHLQNEPFDIITSIRGLPLGVRDALSSLFGTGALDIAEPGAEFQRTDVVGTQRLPPRRLVAAGCSPDHHCLVYYERGGLTPSWRIALFHWTPNATRFEGGGMAPAGLRTVDEVRKAILAGSVKAGSW